MIIGLIILLMVILLLLCFALWRQWNYQVLLKKESSKEIKKKIQAYRLILHEKQIFIFLITTLLLSVGLGYSSWVIYNLENRIIQLEKSNKSSVLTENSKKVLPNSSTATTSKSSNTTQKETKENKK